MTDLMLSPTAAKARDKLGMTAIMSRLEAGGSYASAYEEAIKRENHTGTQPMSTVEGLVAALANFVTNSSLASTLASYATSSSVSSAISTSLSAYSTTSQMNIAISNALANYATTSSVSSAISTALNSYSTTTAMNASIAAAIAGIPAHTFTSYTFSLAPGLLTLGTKEITVSVPGLLTTDNIVIQPLVAIPSGMSIGHWRIPSNGNLIVQCCTAIALGLNLGSNSYSCKVTVIK